MGLVNLVTNLADFNYYQAKGYVGGRGNFSAKKLPYGDDRFGGGSSQQPYIRTSIPDKLGEYGFLNQDFILRGGSKVVKNSALDIERLSKYFIDVRNPSGLLFIAKQNLLARTAVATQASSGPSYGTSSSKDWKKAAVNEGIYTPLSTLIEAGGVAFGLHVNKQGLSPFDGPGAIQKYTEVVTPDQSIYYNRLVDVYANIELKQSDSVDVFSYSGGPGSFLGVGKTHIRLTNQRTGINSSQLRNIGFFNGFSTPLFYPTLNGEDSQTKDYNYSVFSIGNSDTDRTELEPQISNQLGASGKEIPEEYRDLNNNIVDYFAFTIDKSKTDRSGLTLNYNRGLGLSLGTKVSGSDKLLSDTTYTGFNTSGQLLSPTDARDAKPSVPSKVLTDPQPRYVQAFTANNKLISINGNKLLGLSVSPRNTLFNPNVLSSPSATGFTDSSSADPGSIDSNYRVVGNLSTPDLAWEQSEANSSTDVLTFGFNDIKNLPTSPDNNGGSFVMGPTSTTPGLYTTAVVGDFRQKLRGKSNLAASINAVDTNGATSLAPDYYTKNIQLRVNLGDPGDRFGKNLKSYTNGVNPGKVIGYSGGNASDHSYDKINALHIYQSTEVAANGAPVNDLVKFRIGVIDNDTPSLKTYIHFRAFLNQISDGYTADWNSTQYIGRGEKFYNYTGFDRKVSLSWTVAAQSKAELIPMYKKLNFLASVCAPDYSPNGYLRGNIVTLTVGGYFYEQPGIITGFNYEMNDDNATWEIGISDDGGFDHTVKELPHLIKVSGFNFIPIHTFVPRKQINNYQNQLSSVLDDGVEYGPERYISLETIGNINGPASEVNNYGPIYRTPNPSPPLPPPQPQPKPIPPAPPKAVPLGGIVNVSGNTAQTSEGKISNLVKDNPVNTGNTGVAGFSDKDYELRQVIRGRR